MMNCFLQVLKMKVNEIININLNLTNLNLSIRITKKIPCRIFNEKNKNEYLSQLHRNQENLLKEMYQSNMRLKENDHQEIDSSDDDIETLEEVEEKENTAKNLMLPLKKHKE